MYPFNANPKCKMVCSDAKCTDGVVQSGSRWYVTMGHPGFNTPSNNRQGYASEAAARATIARYVAKAKAGYARDAAIRGGVHAE